VIWLLAQVIAVAADMDAYNNKHPRPHPPDGNISCQAFFSLSRERIVIALDAELRDSPLTHCKSQGLARETSGGRNILQSRTPCNAEAEALALGKNCPLFRGNVKCIFQQPHSLFRGLLRILTAVADSGGCRV